MKKKEELLKQLRSIDHKGYKAYKSLEGEYAFGEYVLCIDHVQGDPFATPSRVRVAWDNRGNIPEEFFNTPRRKTAAEDYLLRRFHKNLRAGVSSAGCSYGRASKTQTGFSSNDSYAQEEVYDQRGQGRQSEDAGYSSRYGSSSGQRGHGRRSEDAGDGSGYGSTAGQGGHGRQSHGSGKSGLITACRCGQEILERTAMRILPDKIELRMEIGFPAYGRTIAAGELEKILFGTLPELISRTLRMQPAMRREMEEVRNLADDQQYIRDQLTAKGLAAFVADGSILPRESGISQRPLKGAVPFESPKSLAVTLDLPHAGQMRGMGIKRGVTVIAGGGFHGKSTLLKALERGVYDHIAGDGREYVITDDTAFKLRAEEGRCIRRTDISMFINNLPSGADTTLFSTENASGSTSQAANTVEALSAGSRVLLIDEDTSATNFMIRDGRMAALVADNKEPITPFVRKVRSLYEDLGVSTILVAGSSGDYLSVADTVLQMDCYRAKDVTERARELAGDVILEKAEKQRWVKDPVKKRHVEKVRIYGRDTISLDKKDLDIRYLEQITDESQTAALAYIIKYIFSNMADGRTDASLLAKEASAKLDKEGIWSMVPPNYSAGAAAFVRRQEILAALARCRTR